MKNAILFTLMLIGITGCAQKAGVVEVKNFAKGLNATDVQILDVRTIDEYNNGHIKNALQADWNNKTEFANRTQHLDKTKPLYIYCQAGGRSAAANQYFVNNGFTQVVELKGGMIAWKQAAQDVEGKSNTVQMTMGDYNKLISDTTKIYLVDIGATWCPPCVKQKPILDALVKAHPNKFVLINIDGGTHINLKDALKVDGFPALLVYKNGVVSQRFDGFTEKDKIEKALF